MKKSLQKLAIILFSAMALSSCNSKKDFTEFYTTTSQGYVFYSGKSSPYQQIDKDDKWKAFRWIDGKSFTRDWTPGVYITTEPKDKMGSGIYQKCTHIDNQLNISDNEKGICILPIINKKKKNAEFFVFADEQYAKDKISASWGDYEDKGPYKRIGFEKIDNGLYVRKISVKYRIKPFLNLSSSTEIIEVKEVIHLTN